MRFTAEIREKITYLKHIITNLKDLGDILEIEKIEISIRALQWVISEDCKNLDYFLKVPLKRDYVDFNKKEVKEHGK